MKIRSWSESSGAMLVPSTFTGWYKKTMMTSARPMAIKRSRVQTRIWLRSHCGARQMRFGIVACVGALPLTYIQIHGTALLLQGDYGQRSKFWEHLWLQSEPAIRYRGRSSRKPVQRRQRSPCARSGGRARPPHSRHNEPPRIPYRSTHPPDQWPGSLLLPAGLAEFFARARQSLAQKALLATLLGCLRRRFLILPRRPARAGGRGAIAARPPVGFFPSGRLA